MMKTGLLRLSLFIFYLAGPGAYQAAGQQTFPRNGPYDERAGRYAFTNATIIADKDTRLTGATLLVENGYIRGIGSNVAIPQGTTVYDLKGKYLYPSFIDLQSSYGVPESVRNERIIGGRTPQLESNKKGVFGWNQAIHSERRAAGLFEVNEAQAAVPEYRLRKRPYPYARRDHQGYGRAGDTGKRAAQYSRYQDRRCLSLFIQQRKLYPELS